MFEKEAEEYVKAFTDRSHIWSNDKLMQLQLREAYKDGAEFGYNKGKEDVKYELMMKLKDEGIVKSLKDSILRNERLSSQEQQELCAWIECAMDLGENLDECAKELEQIRNERNLFQERCEDIELNYYCDKVDCQFLSRNEWHYPSKGELPENNKLCLIQMKTGTFEIAYRVTDLCWKYKNTTFSCSFQSEIYAWKEIVLPEPSKYWDLSTGENNINKEKE